MVPEETADSAFWVVVPPETPLEEGVRQALELQSQARMVVLVGYGVSTAEFGRRWPQAQELPRFDLGVLVTEDCVAESKELREGLKEWLQGLFPGLGLALYGTACQRFYQKVFEANLFRKGLAGVAAAGRLLVAGNASPWALVWKGAPRGSSGWIWRIRLLAEGLGGLALLAWKLGRDYWRRRPLLSALKRAPGTGSPRAWLLLHNEWYRLNSALIQQLALSMFAAGAAPGVLLWGDMVPGHRREEDLVVVGRELFSGLGPLKEQPNLLLEQVAWPESVGGILRCYLQTARACASALIRLILSRARQYSPRLYLDCPKVTRELAKLATVDVCRCLAARLRLASLPWLRPVHLFSSGSSSSGVSIVDLVLQERGTMTVEFYHGAGAEDWVGAAESPARLRVVWTHVDACSLESMGQATKVGGMPWTEPCWSEPASSGVRRLLLATNYLHRDYSLDGFFPYELYLCDLLNLASRLHEEWPGQFLVRWRPHPAEVAQVEAGRSRLQTSGVSFSPNTTLGEDLAWCDGILSTMSSVAVEALAWNKPVFLHVLPRFAKTAYARAFATERKFFSNEEALSRLADCFLLARRPELKPERLARRNFFGPGARPEPFESILQEIRTSDAFGPD